MQRGPIRVLVVDDSAVVREFIAAILSADPQIEVAGTARNGAEAIEAAKEHKPDIITMDMMMPKMNGFEATRRIMEECPIPIVIVSGSDRPDQVATTFQAIEAGALTAIPRPPGMGAPGFEAGGAEFLRTIKLMSEVKVVRRWHRARGAKATTVERVAVSTDRGLCRAEVVAIGASTGGPLALKNILSGLPRDFSAPVLIVQHMAAPFIEGFVQWLSEASGFPARLARHNEQLTAGQAYVSPGDCHLGVSADKRIKISEEGPENGVRPSVSHLFRAVAKTYGGGAVGVLLSGMGRDGADELRSMKDTGAVTIAQDQESCVVFGMPGEAIKLEGATYVLPPEQIAEVLKGLVQMRGRHQ